MSAWGSLYVLGGVIQCVALAFGDGYVTYTVIGFNLLIVGAATLARGVFWT